MKVDWKQKYMELRSKYMNALDVAFRMGVEEGLKTAKLQQAEAAAAAAEEAAAMGGAPGMPGEPGMGGMEEGGGEMIEEPSMEGAGDESQQLDSSIDELEQYVKNENIDLASLMKSFHKNKNAKVEDKDKNKAKAKQKISSILEKWEDEE